MSKCCIIKSNTPELRQRLEQSGISVCISFKEADWLCCWESNMAYEWLILVKESGNQYKPCELNGVVVKELTLEQWNQIIE